MVSYWKNIKMNIEKKMLYFLMLHILKYETQEKNFWKLEIFNSFHLTFTQDLESQKIKWNEMNETI